MAEPAFLESTPAVPAGSAARQQTSASGRSPATRARRHRQRSVHSSSPPMERWRSASPSRDHRCGAVEPPGRLTTRAPGVGLPVAAHLDCDLFEVAAGLSTGSGGSSRDADTDTDPCRPMPRTMPIVLDRGGPSLDLRLPRLDPARHPVAEAIGNCRRGAGATSRVPHGHERGGGRCCSCRGIADVNGRVGRAPAIPSRGAPYGADAGARRVPGGRRARVGSRLARPEVSTGPTPGSAAGSRSVDPASGRSAAPYPDDEGKRPPRQPAIPRPRAPVRIRPRHPGPPAPTAGATRPPTEYGRVRAGVAGREIQIALAGLMGFALVVVLVARSGAPGGSAAVAGASSSARPSASAGARPSAVAGASGQAARTPRPSAASAAASPAATGTSSGGSATSGGASGGTAGTPNASANPTAAAAGATAAPTKASTAARTYRVKSGDTLSAIAARFGTTVATLMRLNNIKDRADAASGPGAQAALTAARRQRLAAAAIRRDEAARTDLRDPRAAPRAGLPALVVDRQEVADLLLERRRHPLAQHLDRLGSVAHRHVEARRPRRTPASTASGTAAAGRRGGSRRCRRCRSRRRTPGS